jgi:hypothetical protein
MAAVTTVARVVLAGAALAEAGAAAARFRARQRLFAQAAARAHALGRLLVVVGDPDSGAHTRLLRAYDCGDVTVDLGGAPACPRAIAADLTAGPVPGLADGSGVVFVSCVFEYVRDPEAAWREVLRIAGAPENVFVVEVQAWTATAHLYPGARWTVASPPGRASLQATPVSAGSKWAWGLGLVALGALSLGALSLGVAHRPRAAPPAAKGALP